MRQYMTLFLLLWCACGSRPEDRSCGKDVSSWVSYEYYRSEDLAEAIVQNTSEECGQYLAACSCWNDFQQNTSQCPCRRLLTGVTTITSCSGVKQIYMADFTETPHLRSTTLSYSTSTGKLIEVALNTDGPTCKFYSDQAGECKTPRVDEVRCTKAVKGL